MNLQRQCSAAALAMLMVAPVLLAQTSQASKGDAQIVTTMTYNLKFASPTFQPPWEVRKKWQIDLIRKYDPDILGTQVEP